ncbi:WYL domain-containing protein [Gordonia jinghuaiqii]|uniref:WYL domain-containing protein n=1 Tax=Gordonia jinghuaiqii TaxID=2758710 RepID=A0A7D7QFN7_9ACTN|nr:WYL domain-containing protein [Gordonia jinghuaiqii]QMS99901.1 WYL domain-containing protein [Gordonia jinghuaiqii]
MPVTPSTDTSRRLLSLLSLLQSTRDWPGSVLAERLHVSERTVRRDVERLRDLGYRIDGTKGREGGYRLDAGAVVPPMLFDDEQVVAIAIALQTAGATGAGIGEPSARALSTLRQVLPSRLRARIDTVEVSAVGARADQARTEVLLPIGAAIRGHEELRFDYHSGRTDPVDATPRRTQPHHLVARHGRWYLVGWDSNSGDWRIYRADRMTPRVPTGPRFVPREVPGGDVGEFLSARFKGAEPAATGRSGRWPCEGEVILHVDAMEAVSFLHDGVIEPLGPGRCRVRLGSWSWTGLCASLLRFDADIEVIGPADLRDAFSALATRSARAGGA